MNTCIWKKYDKGFTLIELLVTLSIGVFVTAGISMATITVMRLSPQSNNWAVALSQVQNAGFRISRDVEMSKSLTVDEDPMTPVFLTLVQPEWDEGSGAVVNKTLTYELEDMSGSLKRLVRIDQSTGGQTMISEYIYYDPVNDPDASTRVIEYASVDGILTLRMVATHGDATVSREYKASHRVSAD